MTNHVDYKRTWRNLIAAIAAVALLAACGEGGLQGGPEGTVTAVEIEGGDVTLQEGSTTTLSVNVTADDGVDEAVDWTSDDESVATVNPSGVVSGISEGTADITATSRENDAASDTVTVTVVPEGTPVDPGDPVDPGEFDYLVTETGDTDPYWLQDWPAETPMEGTLRYALANASDGDVIGFADDVDEIVLHGVDVWDEGNIDSHLVFRNDVRIVGPEGGLTIRGTSGYDAGSDPDDGAEGFTYRSRVMFVPAGVNVTLENVEVTGGDFIFYGGGIRNDGELTLRNVTVTGNRAWELGGGIYNLGTLLVEDSVISDNLAVTYDDEVDSEYSIRGGGEDGFVADLSDGGYGGGIYNAGDGVVTVRDSVIAGNTSKGSGGAIYDTGASFTLVGSTVEGNVTTDEIGDRSDADDTDLVNYGGGVFTESNFEAEDVTFSENESPSNGGAFYLDADGDATLTAPMAFLNNDAPFGAGIFHQHDGDPSNLSPADPASVDGFEFTGNSADSPLDADYYAQDTTEDPDDGLMMMRSADEVEPRSGYVGMPDRP